MFLKAENILIFFYEIFICVCNVFWSSYQPPFLFCISLIWIISNFFPFHFISSLFYYIILLCQIIASQICKMAISTFFSVWTTYQWPQTPRKRPSIALAASAFYITSARNGATWDMPPLVGVLTWRIFFRSCTGHQNYCYRFIRTADELPVPNIHLHSLMHNLPALKFFCITFPSCSLNPRGENWEIDASFITGHSQSPLCITLPHYESVLTTLHYKKKLFW